MKVFAKKEDMPKSCEQCKNCLIDEEKVGDYCDLTGYTVCLAAGDNREVSNRLKTNRHASCPFDKENK